MVAVWPHFFTQSLNPDEVPGTSTLCYGLYLGVANHWLFLCWPSGVHPVREQSCLILDRLTLDTA